MGFEKIVEFEQALAQFTGAPYAVMTDCCTHAIELCLRYDKSSRVLFPAQTYLSIPMTMHKLGISYDYTDKQWIGEYQFISTRIWDSARLLKEDMYRPGQLQCLSFGYDKPLSIGRGGAILTDDIEVYDTLKHQCYDGRDLSISPWGDQKIFKVGYHYKPTIEEAERGTVLLSQYSSQPPRPVIYPDCRQIIIID
jgi:dTDP-4-amino-4,6-dideoxygalactose transaminase